MDILKREISPVPGAAWDEIDAQARRVLATHLSARRLVDVSGPHGWGFSALPLGRIEIPEGQCSGKDICFGVRAVLRLVEVRAAFEMGRWELDDIARGAKDIDFSPLDAAARKIADFEEKAIYHGLPGAGFVGIAEAAKANALPLDRTNDATILASLAAAVGRMRSAAVEGPYVLAAGPSLWSRIVSSGGYPLAKRISALTGGDIVTIPSSEEAYLVSMRGGDAEFAIGQDLAVGFEAATEEKVRLFFTESFAFRVINPEAIVPLA